MSAAAEYLKRADAVVNGVDPDTVPPALEAAIQAYERKRDEEGVAWLFARALLRVADRVGTGAPVGSATVNDLKAEIERRNEGRDEADLIVPDGKRKADLEAALKADDERA